MDPSRQLFSMLWSVTIAFWHIQYSATYDMVYQIDVSVHSRAISPIFSSI